MVTILEFNWNGETITKYINTEDLYKDIKDEDSFWGEFYLNGKSFQFQIFWNGSEIAIFEKGGVEPIYFVDSFNLYFSRNLK